jgi:hypothetical protein
MVDSQLVGFQFTTLVIRAASILRGLSFFVEAPFIHADGDLKCTISSKQCFKSPLFTRVEMRITAIRNLNSQTPQKEFQITKYRKHHYNNDMNRQFSLKCGYSNHQLFTVRSHAK